MLLSKWTSNKLIKKVLNYNVNSRRIKFQITNVLKMQKKLTKYLIIIMSRKLKTIKTTVL